MHRVLLLLALAVCSAHAALSFDKTSYAAGEPLAATFARAGKATPSDWIGIYLASAGPPDGSPSSHIWLYTGSESQVQLGAQSSGSLLFTDAPFGDAVPPAYCGQASTMPLAAGDYAAYYMKSGGYAVLAGPTLFTVGGGGAPPPPAPTPPPAGTSHVQPGPGQISLLAVSSCYAANPSSAAFDRLTGAATKPDAFVWMGDNIYGDTTTMSTMRQKYDAKKADASYAQFLAAGIPTLATWDDHDFGQNNAGRFYPTRAESQQEFVRHFDLPVTDPRHANFAGTTREGVYSSHLFGSAPNSMRVIALDARYHRSNTLGTPCDTATTLLGADQWAWLQGELDAGGDVVVIVSGMQVLPPLDSDRDPTQLCAEGGAGYAAALASLEEPESAMWGCRWESWAEVPQEKDKLLRMAQKAVNAGSVGAVVFASGDQHWGELSTKTMAATPADGPAVTFREVTASGIDQSWSDNEFNALRTGAGAFSGMSDSAGGGAYTNPCAMPFTYAGKTYKACTTDANANVKWCPWDTAYQAGRWGNCERFEQANYVSREASNYGEVEVDWLARTVTLRVIAANNAMATRAADTFTF
jgi:alkaline phosphatase D